MNRLILTGLTLLALAWICAAAPATAATAHVISVQGAATLLKAGAEPGQPLRYGDVLTAGDLVVTGKDGKAKLKFDYDPAQERDDNFITLSPSSRLQISSLMFDGAAKSQQTVIKLLMGKVRVLVQDIRRYIDAKFEVETPNAVAGVRGTYFVVGFDPANMNTLVATLHGAVDVMHGERRFAVTENSMLNVGSQAPAEQKPLDEAAIEELEQETKMDELPPPADVDAAPQEQADAPAWFAPAGVLPPNQDANADNGVKQQFGDQLFGNTPQTFQLPPPIQQESGAAGGNSPVNINVNGLP